MLQVNLALIKGGKIMLFAKKNKIEEVYVLKTNIVSNSDDGVGLGPRRRITCYFLAKKKKEKYFELFSNVEIKKELSRFNVPVIEEVKPLTDYISDKYKARTMESKLLFDFLLHLNMENIMELIIDIENGGKRDGE